MVLLIVAYTVAWMACELYHDLNQKQLNHKAKMPMRIAFFACIPLIFSVDQYFKTLLLGPALFWPCFNIITALLLKQPWWYIDEEQDPEEDNSFIDSLFNRITVWIGYVSFGGFALLAYLYL